VAFDKKKFLDRFIDEAKDHIKKLNAGLLILEKNPDDMETLNAVFRSAHTIKGSSRMMKLIPVGKLAHKLEDILDAVRQKKIKLTRQVAELLFRGIDTIETMLDSLSAGNELEGIPKKFCEELYKAAQGELSEQPIKKIDQTNIKTDTSQEKNLNRK
jgi:chemotaxis protein histidine kinase CheA